MDELYAFIATCGKGRFTIEEHSCANLPSERKAQLKKLLSTNRDCFQELEVFECEADIYVCLILKDDVVVGYSSYVHFDNVNVGYVMYMCNDGSLRGQNIGVLMMIPLIVHAIKKGAEKIVTHGNANSLPIFQHKFGFTIIEDWYSPNFYKTPMGELAMSISKEINCFLDLSPTNLPKVKSDIVTVLKNCKLKGGTKKKRKARRTRRSNKSVRRTH